MIDIDHHKLTGPSGLPYLRAQLIEIVANAWQIVPTLLTFHQPPSCSGASQETTINACVKMIQNQLFGQETT
jgi:hypothetical protein